MMIDCVKAYMNTCPLLSEIIPKKRHIDFTEDSPDNYGIFPSGDTETGNSYINGDEERLYTFAVYVRRMSDTDAVRLESSGFIERLQDWFNSSFPELPADCDLVDITAQNAMLLEENKAGTRGTYQVQCAIRYIKHYSH